MKCLSKLSEFSNIPVFSEIVLKHVFNKKGRERLWWKGVLEQFEWIKLFVACSFISRGCSLSSEHIQQRFWHSFSPLQPLLHRSLNKYTDGQYSVSFMHMHPVAHACQQCWIWDKPDITAHIQTCSHRVYCVHSAKSICICTLAVYSGF